MTMLKDRLSYLPFELSILEGASVPEKSYNALRNQYESLLFLDLARQYPGDRVLGITDVDLFAEPLNFVFGQAEISGKAAVISLSRLKGKKKIYYSRTVKEAVHELGHTFGLRHCDEETCVMHFSNCLAETDLKGEKYCASCDKDLRRKGFS
ncbi:MAG: archaemetzincin family Zn-dependent metalloprotease [Thermoplasmata archaeon]|nr:MAG: archaemetzincin family Zn-dependent metalloprotease [Thermoplasmata archaeon]